MFHNATNFPDPQAIREEVEASAAWLKRLEEAEIYVVLTDGLDITDRRLVAPTPGPNLVVELIDILQNDHTLVDRLR